jgi:hypothetical protein
VPEVQLLLEALVPPIELQAWLRVTGACPVHVTTASPLLESRMVPTVFPAPSLMFITPAGEVESETMEQQTTPFFLKTMDIESVFMSSATTSFPPSE